MPWLGQLSGPTSIPDVAFDWRNVKAGLINVQFMNGGVSISIAIRHNLSIFWGNPRK